MFCGKCGAKIEEGVRFCGSCGEIVDSGPASQANQFYGGPAPQSNQYYSGHGGPTPQAQSNQYYKGSPSPLKLNNKMIGIIACAMVAVIVVVAIAGAGGGYKSVVSKYFKAIETTNENTYYSLLQNEYIRYMTVDSWYKNTNEFKKDIKKELEEELDSFKSSYGANIKFSHRIVNATKFTREELQEAEAYLVNSYGFKRGQLKDAYKLKIDLTVKGSRGSGEYEITNFIVVKIGNKWCLQRGYIGW